LEAAKQHTNLNGKVPPQDLAAEKVIIGGMLIDSGAVGVVSQKMKSGNAFYYQKHSLIFEAIKSVDDGGISVDMITVINELRKTGKLEMVGGEHYIIELSTGISSTAHIDHHIDIVMQMFALRRVTSLGNLLAEKSFDLSMDAENILESAMKMIDHELSETATVDFLPWNDVLQKVLKSVEELSNGTGPSGIPTGFSELDDVIGGWQNSELIVLAARPGMGKTALAVKFLSEAAKAKKSVAIFQLEMQDVQFAKRIVANEAVGLHANQLYKHGIKDEKQFEHLQKTVDGLAGLNIHIIPKSGMTVFECRMEARKLKRSKAGLDFVIVDYIQLMSGGLKGGGNREQEISQVSRELKKLANELDIPVLALSQLSREVEKRGVKRPMLSDLRESGAIEQDADMVMFIYRPEYYGHEVWTDGRSVGESCVGQADISIAKHRNGSNQTITVGFDDNKVKFHELEKPFE
jgi:replicative DNA helicase